MQTQQTQQQQDNCAGAATQFTKCMDEQSGNMQICNWYLEQLVCFSFSPFCSSYLFPGGAGF